MRQIATWCFRHRWTTVTAWLATVAVLVAVHSAAGSVFTNNFRLAHTGSFDAIALLQRSSPRDAGETDQLVIAVDRGQVTIPAVRARAQRLFAQVSRLPYVASVASPYTPRGQDQIAPGGRVAFADVTFTNAANHDAVTDTMARRFDDTITSASGGGVQFQAEGNIAEAGDPATQDSSLEFGFLAAAVVLFVAFGSFTATLLPLVCAATSLGAGLSVVGLLSHVIDTATFSGELALLIGLGVGVDYALFIVTRYKQALRCGADREAATVQAIDTSGRAVLFAGLIVCVAMLGMLALGVSFLYGVAIAAAVTVAFTVAASLTLLPALLGIAGGLVPRRRERHALRHGTLTQAVDSPLWTRWGEAMGRRPALFAVATALVMIVIALPF
ncbi:MAG: MMPL family transporter, partial [Solirubrobacteraceae bacterium]